MYKKNKRRKWKRGRTKFFVFPDNFPKHKYDYAQKREYLNPRRLPARLSFKKKVQLVSLAGFLLAILALTVFHPFFFIKKIVISGLNRIGHAPFAASVETIINCKKFLVFPCQSYVFVDVDEISEFLSEKYSLNWIRVKKEFPHSLTITLEEKISTVIYDNTQNYRTVDLLGDFIDTLYAIDDTEWHERIGPNEAGGAVTTTVHLPNLDRLKSEFGDYPVIYDATGAILAADGQKVRPELVQAVIDWYNFLNKKINLPFSYVEIESSVGDAKIHTQIGWSIFVKLGERFGEQTDELSYLLTNKIGLDARIEYIELRFPDRVYWK